jgi:hypothetical protein
VHTNVGHKVMLITSSKGYFCTNFYIQWSCDVTSPAVSVVVAVVVMVAVAVVVPSWWQLWWWW